MDKVSVLFCVYYITVCSGTTRYTGSFYAPIKNITLAAVKNWQYSIRRIPIEDEDDFWQRHRDEQYYKRLHSTLYPSFLEVMYVARMRRQKAGHTAKSGQRGPLWPVYHPARRPSERKKTRSMYHYQNMHFAGERSRFGFAQYVHGHLRIRGRKFRRFTTTIRYIIRTFNMSSRKRVILPSRLRGVGRDFIYANRTRLKSPYSKTFKFKWSPGLEDFNIQRPVGGTVKDGFRILFSEDPKKRIVGIKVNANRNKPFKGFGDNTPGEMIVDAELTEKENKTKWVATYRDSRYIKNHDVIFYWYVYTLKVGNKTYHLYGYDNYFRLYFEFLMRSQDVKELIFANCYQGKY